ncbi:hypothetical protein NCLIV_021590 [Neospora caninum Liverpool]|uniref:Uncharacterized protein n=1 Tax=Neospora caninum (strain Liverpool) TaxID=572307 RepID=F0VF77_NEOCL|nr:hypothetical protein NCLIV_021590 [Neospora caninum Liverpool]CBZ52371.1 hypothetical protein NCLIV_021590 [Neospora caninum Liverpool]CEL66342.1 TPA: hypothetical protein BN1204_021590 [Neospora caninum Liverpool]|eukprot:XP_003882403.1 hypothetical protein NCLIV_021590 [Neospora caninum Liverpool]
MAFASDVSKMMMAAHPPPAGRLAMASGASSLLQRSNSSGSLSSQMSFSSTARGALRPPGASEKSQPFLGAAGATSRTPAGGNGAFLASHLPLGRAAGSAVSGLDARPSLRLSPGDGKPRAGSAVSAPSQAAQGMVVVFRGQQTGVGFLLNKLLELLKKEAGRSFHVKEIEKSLIQMGFTGLHPFFQPNSEFVKLLSSNERIGYNPRARTLAFHNPFQTITSCSALLAKIQHEGALTGLKVDSELLCAHAEMTDWINSLLASRQVRAIRCNNNHLRGKRKCAALGTSTLGSAANSAAVCDIYAARKCANCRQNLCGLLLYPLGEEIYEQARMDLDAEVKGLWDSIVLPPLEDIIKECDPNRSLTRQTAAAAAQDKTQLKRRAEEKRVSRFRSKFRRIHNTHLFTAEELRAFTNEQASS